MRGTYGLAGAQHCPDPRVGPPRLVSGSYDLSLDPCLVIFDVVLVRAATALPYRPQRAGQVGGLRRLRATVLAFPLVSVVGAWANRAPRTPAEIALFAARGDYDNKCLVPIGSNETSAPANCLASGDLPRVVLWGGLYRGLALLLPCTNGRRSAAAV